MADQLQLTFLGTFQVTRNSEPVTGFAYDKVRALLAYLAVEADIPHRRDSLAALFWPEQPDKVAHKSLNQALYTLRRALGDRESAGLPFILADHVSVRFNPAADVWLDTREFSRRLAGPVVLAGMEMAPAVLARLQEAVELYRGDFLQGFFLPDSAASDDWAVLQRERLHRQATEALFTLAAYHERRGEVTEAIHYARRLLALEAWREETYRLLMALLARSGQRSAALIQYERCARILAEELNSTPAPETVALYERIKGAAAARLHNLPPQPTPFVGRQEELAHLLHLIGDPNVRLITLVGPGGMGKTRLALAAAAREVENQAVDGVYFVELVPVGALDDPLVGKRRPPDNEIVAGIAQAVGYQFLQNDREPAQQLLNYLRSKNLLLILDNFEHLLDGASLVSQILQAAPGIKVMITSREPLQLIEEQVFPVPVLDFTWKMVAEADAAVQLFLQRAGRAQPDFALQPADIPHLTAICRLVGGMPLALELAAAWVTTLTLADIAAEIERGLEILTTDLRNLPPRQRSITVLLDASWQRLTATEQRLLRRLSFFPGSFDHLAAQAVGGASLPALSTLVSKSLLWRDHLPLTAVHGHARFALHELVRRFAAQQLAGDNSEDAAARQAYTRYYAAFLQARQPFLDGPRPQEALAEIALEYTNVRQAVLFACEMDDVVALGEMQEALHSFYLNAYRSFHEAELIFGRMAAAIESATALAAQTPVTLEATLSHVLCRLAYFCVNLGKLDEARSHNNRALELARRSEDAVAEVAVLNNLGGLALRTGDYAGAELIFHQALLRAESAQSLPWLASTKANLARVLLEAGRIEDARPLLESSRQIRLERGIPDFHSLLLLGRLNMLVGELEEAGRQLDEALTILSERGGLPILGAATLISLGRLALQQGDRDQAQRRLAEALSLAREVGLAREIAEAEQLLGLI